MSGNEKEQIRRILLGHGGGGKLTGELLEKIIFSRLSNPILDPRGDSAVVDLGRERIAFTTDSYVISPIFFPGGDIGSLAVSGTVNDLSVMGAEPLVLSLGLIIEEGLEEDSLAGIIASIRKTADAAGVVVATGDTKVVENGKADRIFINTSGIGKMRAGIVVEPERIENGDQVIVSGTIADHGIAVLLKREGLEFDSSILSDAAPLNGLIAALLDSVGGHVKFMRDPTRGGLASVLNETVRARGLGIRLLEDRIPIKPQVLSACDILGLDPLYVANEGKVVVVVSKDASEQALETLRSHPLGLDARIIGEVTDEIKSRVVLKTAVGGHRIVDQLIGDQLPRIC